MKYIYKADHVNFFIKPRVSGALSFKDYEYEILVAPTSGYVSPPIKKRELKELADFIYQILNQTNTFTDDLPMEPRGPFHT